MILVPRRISARAIILQTDDHASKLLCVRQRPYNPIAQSIQNHWNLPGGKLDIGESLTDCLIREIQEETGVRAVVGNLMYVQQFSFGGVEYLEFFFYVSNTEDFLNIDLAVTTHGEAEIAEIEFVDPTIVEILPKFLMTEDLVSQTQKPTAFFSLL